MKRNDYCPFCNILVAPAASDRVECDGQAAHDSCVRRDKSVFAKARNLCSAFLISQGAAFAASAFEIKFARVNSTRDFGRLVGLVLRKHLEGVTDPQQRAATIATASEIATTLNIAIDVGEKDPPKAKTNGKARNSRA